MSQKTGTHAARLKEESEQSSCRNIKWGTWSLTVFFYVISIYVLRSQSWRLTELRYRCIELWRCPTPWVKFLDLGGRNWFVWLAGGSVHRLHPQDPVLLVITGKDNSVAFFHSVEECPTAIETWRTDRWRLWFIYMSCHILKVLVSWWGWSCYHTVHSCYSACCYLVGGQCSPQCSHQAEGVPQAPPSFLCSCTWQRCTGSPTPITERVGIVAVISPE